MTLHSVHPATVPPPAVPLAGPRTSLRVVEPRDYPWIRDLTSRGTNLVQWRDRGQTTRPEQFVENLWAGVVAQFVVERRSTGEPLGVVTCFGVDQRNRHAHLAVLFDPDAASGRGWRAEALVLFVNYVFEVFDLRKLYAEVLEFNLPEIASAVGRYVAEEGVLVDHEYLGGRYWDMHLLAIHRDGFLAHRDRLLRRLAPVDAPG